jgi:hypothetical protein
MSITTNLILLGIAILYAIAPLIVTVIGLRLISVFGCSVSGIIVTCPNHRKLGSLLTYMISSHWLAIFTVPSGGIAIIVLGVKLFVTLQQR